MRHPNNSRLTRMLGLELMLNEEVMDSWGISSYLDIKYRNYPLQAKSYLTTLFRKIWIDFLVNIFSKFKLFEIHNKSLL